MVGADVFTLSVVALIDFVVLVAACCCERGSGWGVRRPSSDFLRGGSPQIIQNVCPRGHPPQTKGAKRFFSARRRNKRFDLDVDQRNTHQHFQFFIPIKNSLHFRLVNSSITRLYITTMYTKFFLVTAGTTTAAATLELSLGSRSSNYNHGRLTAITPAILIGTGLWTVMHGFTVGKARTKYAELAKKDGEADVDERYLLP